jgi:putative DNA primase/helicase
MTWANYDDVLNQIQAHDFDVQDLEIGVRKRVKVIGLDQKGWYALHEIKLDDGRMALIGAFGWWIGAEKFVENVKLRIDGGAVKLDPERQAAIRQRVADEKKRAEASRKADADRAALAAGAVWRKYSAEGESDYLVRKNVAAHGLRFSPSGNGTVAVPMMDAAGKVWGLQLIRGKSRAKGKLDKEFWPKGVAVSGHYHLVGPIPRGAVLVAEGYATAATLHQASGLPVAVAFSAGNLRPVAEAIKKAYRGVKILVCADDDYLTDGNPGVKAAELAALAVGGKSTTPIFTVDRDGKKLTDFNDLAALEGEAIVRAQIEAALRSAGFDSPAPSARGAAPRGAGERSRKDDIASVIQVDEALERYAMVYGAGGTWFDADEHMLVPKADLVDMLPEHGMRDMRNRKRVVRLDEVGFDPAGTDARIKCNLWGGWPTVPKSGRCTVLLELLEYLCSGEDNPREIYQWVLRWLAYPIQHPGAKMRTALVFHGPQGAGKNLFFETVMAIYGEYGRIVDQSAIEDKFNDWASRKLFLIADEVVARAELYHVKNKLKGIVTGEWIRINPKNVAAHDERNHVNLVFLSNERQPLVLDKDDRRYTVIWTPEKLPEGFYGDIRAELDAGGVAALHHHLATLDLADFSEHSKPPMTQSKRDVIDISMDSVERFVQDWQGGGIVFDDSVGPLPFGPCASADLYGAYGRWCKREGVFKPRESNQFVGHLAKLPRWRKTLGDRFESLSGGKTVRTRFVIPSDEAMQAAIAAGQPDKRRDPAHTQAAWLTTCFFDFQQAMGDRS